MSELDYQRVRDDVIVRSQRLTELRQCHQEVWGEWHQMMADREQAQSAGLAVPDLFQDEQHDALAQRIAEAAQELRQFVEEPRLEPVAALGLWRGLSAQERTRLRQEMAEKGARRQREA